MSEPDASIKHGVPGQQDSSLAERRSATRSLLRDVEGTMILRGEEGDIKFNVKVLNISGGGAAILADKAPRAGQPLRLTLPSKPDQPPIEGHVIETKARPLGGMGGPCAVRPLGPARPVPRGAQPTAPVGSPCGQRITRERDLAGRGDREVDPRRPTEHLRWGRGLPRGRPAPIGGPDLAPARSPRLSERWDQWDRRATPHVLVSPVGPEGRSNRVRLFLPGRLLPPGDLWFRMRPTADHRGPEMKKVVSGGSVRAVAFPQADAGVPDTTIFISGPDVFDAAMIGHTMAGTRVKWVSGGACRFACQAVLDTEEEQSAGWTREVSDLSQKVGQTIVGWVKPTDARPGHTVGFTHPTGSLSTLPGQTLRNSLASAIRQNR